MDEALALRIEHEDLLAIADPTPYLVLDQQMSSGELAVDVSSDFAVALALQLEEQAAAYTVEHSGMPAGALPQNSTAIDDSSPIHSHEVNTYEGSANEIQDELMHNARHRDKGQAKAYRKIRTKPVRPVHVVVVSIDKADDDWLEGGGLYELFFSAVDSFHDIAHEFAFNDNDSF
ncbi:hypothetical protein DYB25_002804 [Aphanomyces astaci]|uniref:Uncharacterized protein n=1 Tax=Aphanomyces astaci TaxID=112090 RepID=A0A397C4Q5_APHAT|nr:hypothetical protein DYB25_002804 [Aphanomyces astaci]RHY38762.1 hypothetical protein DYB30_005798 [Aphanomyces astaci]RHY54292.1 hypothetical protein DYB38_009729 [Aphanomyces astaci]RHY99092.1 hypothetical protein DYB31_002253 [Aphanomyces astaci]